jgi:predicted transcriptional regulator
MKEVVQKKAAEAPKRNPDVRGLNGALRSDSVAGRVAVLQRSIGNRAVERLFRSGVLQAKLKIGRPNDIYEQEADRVAEQVMRMPEPAIQMKPG